jgi:hypothetical protein
LNEKILRSLYLNIEQVERLKKLSAKTKVPQAVYIREGIDLVLKKHSKKKRIIKNGRHPSQRLIKNNLE